MKKMKWTDEEIKSFCKKLSSNEYLQCNYCGHILTNPNQEWIEKEHCPNCGKGYVETESEIRRVKE